MGRLLFWLVIAPLLVGVLLFQPRVNFAQSTSEETIRCQLGATAGARRYRPGKWGLVDFQAVNTTDEESEVQGVLRFAEDPTIQFSRRASIPANSVFRSTCPVLIPDSLPAGKDNIEVLAEQIVPATTGDSERERTPREVRMRAKPILLDWEKPTVGMISELHHAPAQRHQLPFHTRSFIPEVEPDRLVYEMVLAAKRAQQLSRRVSVFDAKDLPATPACLDVLDVLVLSSDRLASDPAGIAMVRDWVLSGGVLWITLDDLKAETVAAVLGEAFSCSVVDRVELSSVGIRAEKAPDSDVSKPVSFETPVDFARVIPEGVTIRHTVNGWPASFWQPFGAGKVYFTTLGPRAWMRPVADEDPAPRSRSDETAFYPRKPLQRVADDCLVPREESPLGAETLTPFLSQQIGYKILDRNTVFAVLLMFCLLLAGAGWRCFRVGHPERTLWVAPVIAASFSMFFLVTGLFTKKSVPPTVATMSRVTLERGVGVGHSSGLVAIYNQDAGRERFGARQGGVFFPDMTGMSGRNRRITWTDEGVWHWENLTLPPGVRTAPFQRPVELKAAVECRARFGEDGLQGSVGPLEKGGLEDAVIALSDGNALAASVDASGRFHCGPEDVLAKDAYTGGALLSDEEVRRSKVYSRLFSASRRDNEGPSRAMLYAWSEPWDLGFVFSQKTRIDSTLISIPVRLERTPPGSRVLIPGPFVTYRAVASPKGRPSIAYSNMTGEWVASKLSTTQWLRFQMPAAVLPLQLEKASLLLGIRAPSRSVEICVPQDKGPAVMEGLSHPIGTYECTIEDAEKLQLDEEGGLRLGIRVGQDEAAESGGQMSQATWKVEHVQLEVAGRVPGGKYER